MKIKILKIIFITILIFFTNTIISNAGIISVSSSTNGDKATVSVSSSVKLGAYTVSISGMTPISSSGGQGAGGSLITNASAEGFTSLATFTFNAPSVDTRVTVSATGMEGTDFSPQTDETVSVTVKAKKTSNNEDNTGESSNPVDGNKNDDSNDEKSSNANLSNLGIKPNDFKGFKPTTKKYNVTVPNDVTSVEVYAYKGNEGQSVSGTGVKNLKEGENTFEVKVVSEDKSKTNTYTIVVTRESLENNEDSNNTTEDTNTIIDEQLPVDESNTDASGLTLKSLKIEGITDKENITIEPNISPDFSPDIYEYTTTVQFDVNSLKIEAEPNSENTTIEILGNENFQIGENIVTILLKDNDTGEQQTYQIIVNKTSDAIILENNIKYIKWGIIIAIIVIILIAIIIAVVNYRKRTKIRDSEFGSNNIFDDEYDVPNNVLDVSKKDMSLYEDNYGLGTYNDDYNNDSSKNRKKGKRFK